METLFGITSMLALTYAGVMLTRINIKKRTVTRKIKELDF